MIKLRPFFSYYGGKYRVVFHYPKPRFRTLIEPFAGSAGYAVKNHFMNCVLYDVNPVVYGVWDYLIKVTSQEILSLPVDFAHIDEVSVCQEAKWLIGYWLNRATAEPRKSPSKWMRDGLRPNSFWSVKARQRIARQVNHIRHWRVYNKSYDEIDDARATWFVDPPYQGKSGRLYTYNAIDFNHLSQWCKSRDGQVIVCEQRGADWLPFGDFRIIRAMVGRGNATSDEVVWVKET